MPLTEARFAIRKVEVPSAHQVVVAAQAEALGALDHRADITWALSPADLGPPSEAEVQVLVNDFTRRLAA